MRNTVLKLLCALMTLFPATAFAAPASPRYSIGIKGGMDLFTFYGQDISTAFSRTGWRNDVGGSLFFSVSNKTPFSAQLELSYSKKGYRYSLEYTSENYDTTRFVTMHNTWDELYKFDYIELPLLLRYRVAQSGRTRLQLYTGPTASILFSAKENITDNGSRAWLDVRSSTASFDFGITAGVAYEIQLGHGHLLIDIRCCGGLLTTHRPGPPDYAANPQMQPLERKNIGAAFKVGYAYDL